MKSALGAAVVGTDTIDTKATDYSGTVTKVKSAGADAVFFGGYYAQAGPLSKQLRDGGVTSAQLVFGDGVKADDYVKLAGTGGDGAVITCPCAPSPADFAAAYKATYEHRPDDVLARGLRLGARLPDGDRRRQDHPHGHQRLPEDHRHPGPHQADQVRRQG